MVDILDFIHDYHVDDVLLFMSYALFIAFFVLCVRWARRGYDTREVWGLWGLAIALSSAHTLIEVSMENVGVG